MKYVSWILTFLFLLNHQSYAFADKVKFLGTEIPGLLERGKKLPYNRLFSNIMNKAGINAELEIAPLARTLNKFNSGQYVGLFPSSLEMVEIQAWQSFHFNKVKVHIFSHLETKPIRSIHELIGKPVGIIRGLNKLEQKLDGKLNLYRVVDEEQNIRMLLNGRIFAFFGVVPDVDLTLDKIAKQEKRYLSLSVDRSISYFNVLDTFVIKKSNQNEAILHQINQAISDLNDSGELTQILGMAKTY